MIAAERQSEALDRKQRRRFIRQVLADSGLVRSRLRLYADSADDVGFDRCRELANAFEQLGPVFSAFGRYLATRSDLLTLRDCSTFAAIPEPGKPTSLDQFCDHETLALLCASADVRATPFANRLFCQWHAGCLHDGREVEVKVVRRISDSERLDLELLPEIETAVEPILTNPALLSAAISDFRDWTAAETDALRLSESLQTLLYDARSLDLLRVPKVVTELSTDRCVTIERIRGQRLNVIVADLDNGVQGNGTSSSHSDQGIPKGLLPSELGRTVCEVWLRQSFRGSLMPLDCHPENIVVISNTEIAITDGQFRVLPSDAKKNLSNYLIATASSETETAVRHLLSECNLSRRTVSDSELGRHFRQAVVPPAEGTNGCQRIENALATHWRVATEHGLQPLHHLASMIRGIRTLSRTTAKLAPDRDPLLDGIKNLRTSELAHEIADLMDPARWGSDFDRIAEVVMFGPQRLDGALNNAAESSSATSIRTAQRAQETSWLLVGLLIVGLMHAAAAEPSEFLSRFSTQQVSVVLFLVLGTLWLRQTKSRRYQ